MENISYIWILGIIFSTVFSFLLGKFFDAIIGFCKKKWNKFRGIDEPKSIPHVFRLHNSLILNNGNIVNIENMVVNLQLPTVETNNPDKQEGR